MEPEEVANGTKNVYQNHVLVLNKTDFKTSNGPVGPTAERHSVEYSEHLITKHCVQIPNGQTLAGLFSVLHTNFPYNEMVQPSGTILTI